MATSSHGADAHHDDHSHGSRESYLKGFKLSLILTALPFLLVAVGGFANPLLTVLFVVGFAAVQVVVHMVYFLHLTGKGEEGWTMMATVFTIIVVVIMLAGSAWVMYHLNTNMMPGMMGGAS